MNIRYTKSATTGDAFATTTTDGVEIEVTFDSGFWRGVDDNYDAEAEEATKGFTFTAKREGDSGVRWSNFLGAPDHITQKVNQIQNFLIIAEPHSGLRMKETEIN